VEIAPVFHECKGLHRIGAQFIRLSPLLPARVWRATPPFDCVKDENMGIDSESDITANLQIGPTSQGMVRIFVEGDGVEVPMDFDPDEAEEIADEIRAAAARAKAMGRKG